MRFFVLALFAFVPAAWGQTVSVYASVDSIRVGERFALTIVARHGIMTEAVLPDTGRAFGGSDLAVLERLQMGTSYGGTREPGTRVDSAVYRVAAFALDTLVVPPIAVGFVQGNDTVLVPSHPFALPMIASAPSDADSLQPARPRMDFPFPLWMWLVGLLALAALAALVYFLFRRRNRPEAPHVSVPSLSPAETARRRLLALEATDLSDPAQVKPYYVDLTDTIRQYIEVTTGIPALELTSGELIRQVQQAAREKRLPAELPGQLVSIFPVADYAKFADGMPSPAEGARVRAEALAVIDRMEAHQMPAPAPSEPQSVEAADA